MEKRNTKKKNIRVKLIFNPISGENSESPVQLMDVIKEMQAWNFTPEPYLIKPDSVITEVVNEAIDQGILMIVVCGGDGTVSSVARALYGTPVILGIIPLGTQNNIAFSLGIPTDIPEAIALLRMGKRFKIDVGMCVCNGISTPLIEICTIGLFSSLYSAGDDIQHGDITKIGDFLSTLTTTAPSEIQLILDDDREIKASGHLVIVSNMPYIVHHYPFGSDDSLTDGLLDVLFFADLTKMELINYMIQGPGTGGNENPRIMHYLVKKIIINTNPQMPIMVDGITLGSGSVQLEAKRKALTVITPKIIPNMIAKRGDLNEK
ncbi:MAG: hypothetical protein A2015_05775 [Spirochaetes bacterium GWF1_31_7]|nr:MAG: hypothetical protein A2Y30_00185 [Spirochaetes bacterium GWE1_32_154]OHD47199.1 MAG: hypothetical protein A2Y29_10770 [Spirochaetes bacterium GWE2_31_10]OHD48932.1 MAG: hypothetical protein A2015_05775 [Spirochaetes bacterium GWF1_31_7]OHD81842.1 MAG: hypothetical protein A2355_13950 [Spirochaetes bacterium RIFOXYB1_FULL_32_8]HBD92593.1 hypothetical protein [Spirochaetia bacterium]